MTSYVIPTPNVKHVIMAYDYMEKKNIKSLVGTMLYGFVHTNNVKAMSQITAIYIFNDVYDGYGTGVPNLSKYDHIIRMEETVTL